MKVSLALVAIAISSVVAKGADRTNNPFASLSGLPDSQTNQRPAPTPKPKDQPRQVVGHNPVGASKKPAPSQKPKVEASKSVGTIETRGYAPPEHPTSPAEQKSDAGFAKVGESGPGSFNHEGNTYKPDEAKNRGGTLSYFVHYPNNDTINYDIPHVTLSLTKNQQQKTFHVSFGEGSADGRVDYTSKNGEAKPQKSKKSSTEPGIKPIKDGNQKEQDANSLALAFHKHLWMKESGSSHVVKRPGADKKQKVDKKQKDKKQG